MLNVMSGGYNKMNLDQLHGVAVTPRGERTGRWQGIQHGELVSTMEDVLKAEHDSLISKPTYAVSPNGAAVIGGFELTDLYRAQRRLSGLPQAVTQSIGFVHSNDSRKALTLCFGGKVMLCNNGMVVADVVIKRKHTKGLRLKEWLSEGLKDLKEKAVVGASQLSELTTYQMTPRVSDNLLLNLARKNILPWRLLGEVDKCWQKALDGKVLWVEDQGQQDLWGFNNSYLDWYNAVTHVAKRIPPVTQLSVLRKSFELVQEARMYTGSRRMASYWEQN